MKKIHILLTAALALCASLTGCDKDKDSEGLTFVEYFPVFTDSDGNDLATAYVGLGESFTPTFKATMDGSDIASSVTVSISSDITGETVEKIPTEEPGMFTVTYSAKTKGGLGTYDKTQQVIVYNPKITTDISGVYTVDSEKTESQDLGGRIEPKDDKQKYVAFSKFFEFFGTSGPATVKLTQIVPGFYTISDAFAGWYAVVRGYGSQYEAKGYIALNEDNSLTLVSSTTPWGDSVEPFESKYDPETKSITFAYNYAGAVDIKGVMSIQ